jgi:cellulose synthase/poly-beta-1,6-N-acetylglucosamine synthase-like glycosyltransferase
MTPDPEKISLIIPARNAGATIGKSLALAVALDDARNEIIIVDDASDESTALVGLFVLVSGQVRFLLLVPLIELLNVWMNRRSFTMFLGSKGALFALAAMIYYTLLYPAAAWPGVLNRLARHLAQRRAVNA